MRGRYYIATLGAATQPTFWHLTNRKDFTPKSSFRPVTASGWDRATQPMLYVTTDPYYWQRIAGGGYATKRKWAAEIRLLPEHPPVDRENPQRPETIVDPALVEVVRVIPVNEAVAEKTGYLDDKYVGSGYRYPGPDFPGKASKARGVGGVRRRRR